MRISDWSSDVCSSDLQRVGDPECPVSKLGVAGRAPLELDRRAIFAVGRPGANNVPQRRRVRRIGASRGDHRGACASDCTGGTRIAPRARTTSGRLALSLGGLPLVALTGPSSRRPLYCPTKSFNIGNIAILHSEFKMVPSTP